MTIVLIGFAVWVFAGLMFGLGYWVGHYEALRCSCRATTQHYLRKLLGLPLMGKEVNEGLLLKLSPRR